jgi:hypothetical protein
MSPFLAIFLVTPAPLHLKVDGDGFLRLMKEGHPVYAREADLTVINGLLGSHGATFLPSIHVAGSLSTIHVDLMGNVDSGGSQVGRLVLALPSIAGAADEAGFFSFSDRPTLTNPGEGVAGVVRFGEGDSKGSAKINVTQPNVIQATVAKPTSLVAKSIGPTKTESAETLGVTKLLNPKLKASPSKTSASGKVEIIVHGHTEVDGEPVKLAEVAEITGPAELVQKADDIVIAGSPAIGVKRLLDQHNLSTIIQGAGIEPTRFVLVCPEGATVVRKSQVVDPDALMKSALDAIDAKFGGKVPLVPTIKARPVLAPLGELTLEPSEPEVTADGYFVTVTIKVGGELVGTQSLSLVPSKDAPRVHQNAPLTVVLISGTATVEVNGKAKSAAYVGQRIEVIIDGVGNKPTSHIGTLVSLDRVEVQL